MESVAVYVHIPFCPSKCGYCDFNSYAMSGDIIERTVDAICREIRLSPYKGAPAKTVFFGGGTPTLLASDQLDRVLHTIASVHHLNNETEITSEANPGTADAHKFVAMRSSGFNRLSIGAQSFQRGDLIRLGRIHQEVDIGRAVFRAREAGFSNVNLDLMFALPGQTVSGWARNLQEAISLRPEHLSLYCLTIEHNTRFYKLHVRGMLNLPDEESQVEMYDLAVRMSEESGYSLYEISNFAKPGFECHHNLCYWRAEPYVGYGPGAVGCVPDASGKRTRYTNLKHPDRYCAAIESGAALWCESEVLSETMLALERIMLGIRLREGLAPQSISREGLSLLHERDWIEQRHDRICLTPKGRHFASEAAVLLA